MNDLSLDIRGIQEVQVANLQLINAMKPGGAVEEGVQYAVLQAHRYAIASTPHDYGALRAAHRAEYEGGLRGRIFIDPGAVAPRRGARPARYGAILHSHGMVPGLRSGIRAFYAYTVEAHGATIVRGAIKTIKAGLP